MPEIINVHSALPLNKQVEQYLRRLISQDEYRQGKMLPTELALSEELGVARNTIRAAMDKLVREGLIERKKGVGTQVKRDPITVAELLVGMKRGGAALCIAAPARQGWQTTTGIRRKAGYPLLSAKKPFLTSSLGGLEIIDRADMLRDLGSGADLGNDLIERLIRHGGFVDGLRRNAG